MSSRISFNILRCIGVPGFSGVGNQRFSSFCSFVLDFMSSFTYLWVSSGSCSVVSAAMSIGRIFVVSSGLRICSSANLYEGDPLGWLMLILMLIRLVWAVANAGTTMMVAVSSKGGNGCTAPVTLFELVVITTALTVVVCYGSSVWFPSANIWRGVGSQFFISSVIANVISTCGKLIVPFAVSISAWWFLMKFSPVMGTDVFDSMTKVSVIL